jgi:hypothetical protein
MFQVQRPGKVKKLSRGEQDRTGCVVSKTGIPNGVSRFPQAHRDEKAATIAICRTPSNTLGTTAPFDSRKRASGGDEFSSLNSRRRRSLRVTDSPCLRE